MDDDKATQPDDTLQQEQDKEDEAKDTSTTPSTSLAPPPPAPTSGSSANLANLETTQSGQLQTLLSPVQRPATAPTASISPTHRSELILPSPFHSPTSVNHQQQSSPPPDNEASRPLSSISGIRPAESAVASHLHYQTTDRVPLFLPPLFNPSSLSGPSSAFAYPGPGYHFPQQQPQSAHAAFPPRPSPFSPPHLAAASTMQQVEVARSPSAGAPDALPATEVAPAHGQEGEEAEGEKTVNSASGNEVEKVEVGEEEERERGRKMSLMALVDATDKVEKEGGAGEAASEDKAGEQEEEEGMVTRARGRKRTLETASPSPPAAVQTTTTEELDTGEGQEDAPAAPPEKRRRTTTSEVDPSLRQAAQQQSVQPHPHAQRISYPTQQQYLGQIYPIHPAQYPPANSSSSAAPGHPHPYTQQPHPHSHHQQQQQQQHFYPSVGWSSLAPPSAPHFPSQQSMARWDGNMPAFLAGQYPSVMGRHGGAAAFSMPAREEEEGAGDEGERGEVSTAQQEEGMQGQVVENEEGGGRSDTSPTSATAPSSYWTTTSPSLSTAYQTSPPQPTTSYPYGHASTSSPILSRGYPLPQYAQQQYPQQQHYLQQQRAAPPPQPAQSAQAPQERPIAPPPGGQPQQIPLVSSSSSSAAASSSRQVFGAGPDEEEGQEEVDSQQKEQIEQGQAQQQQQQQGQKGVGKGKGARMAPPTNAFNVPTTEGVKPFINKLRWLLQHPELVGESICWSESGNEVLLHFSGETDLVESVLPRMYSHSNLGAFYRQFTVYGFTHIKDATRISSILNPHLPQPSTSSAAQPSAAESFAGFSPSPPAPVPVLVSETRDPNEWRVYSHLHSVADYEAAYLAERKEEGEMRRARRSTARAAAVAAGDMSVEEEESEDSEGDEGNVPEEPEEERYWFSRDNAGEERLLRRVKGKGAKDKNGAGGADGKGGKGKGKGKKPASPAGKGKKAAQVAAAMSPSPSPLVQHQTLSQQQAQYQPYAPYHAGNVVPAIPFPQQSPSAQEAALPTSYAQYQAQHPHAHARVSVAAGGGEGGGGGGAMSGLLQQHQGVATRGRTAVQGILRGGEGGQGTIMREVEREGEEGEGGGEETA